MSFLKYTRRIIGTAGVLSLAIGAGTASAQDDKFPSKPIEIVIHASYGGGTDVTARMMMIRTRRELKQDMSVISVRPAPAAHEYAMEKPRDGYTVLALTQTHLYAIAQGKSKLSIDDVVGVARAMDDPTFIVVGKDSPYKTIQELIAGSKDKALNWGVGDIGSTEHIGLARFAKVVGGIKFKAVPFGSGGKMVQALMSNAIDATLPNVSEAGPQVQDGTFRALAVMAAKRLKEYPDVPTLAELGWPLNISTTRGYWVLKGTPQDRIDILSKAMVKAMKHDVFANYLKSSGLSVEDSVADAEVWTKQIREEYEQAVEAMKELGVIK